MKSATNAIKAAAIPAIAITIVALLRREFNTIIFDVRSSADLDVLLIDSFKVSIFDDNNSVHFIKAMLCNCMWVSMLFCVTYSCIRCANPLVVL